MLIIQRSYFDFATFSKLSYNGKEWVGVEKPWKNNQKRISCIPEGFYVAERYKSPTPSRGTVWQLKDVPHRDHIQIHRGNWVEDVIGCLAIGKHFGTLKKTPNHPYQWAVIDSGGAFNEFMKETEPLQELEIHVMVRKI